jgi:hypothetical protein
MTLRDDGLVRVVKAEQVPTAHHYAIITYDVQSNYHAAEGHGYPAYTSQDNVVEHFITKSRNIWENEIIRLDERKVKFVAFEVSGLVTLKKTVTVNIEPVKR